MDHGKQVIKSKSSNTDMATTKQRVPGEKTRKKSRSSAEFQGPSLKKRGMYVEKKSTAELYKGMERKVRPGRRPRRGEASFLNSILNLLCQDTISTQFPDSDNKRRSRRVRRRVNIKTVDKSIQDLDRLASPDNPVTVDSRVAARTSRKLSGTADRVLSRGSRLLTATADSRVISRTSRPLTITADSRVAARTSRVLPTTKDSRHRTNRNLPPTADGRVAPRTSRLLPQGRAPGSGAQIKHKKKYRSKILNAIRNNDDHIQVLSKKVMDSASVSTDQSFAQSVQSVVRVEIPSEKPSVNVCNKSPPPETKSKKKVIKIEEPTTLVSRYSDNQGLYNFFVEFLETTCSGFVNADQGSPNRNMEIDERVAQKLNISGDAEETYSDREGHPNSLADDNECKSCTSRNSSLHYVPDTKKFHILTDDQDDTDNIKVYKPKPNWSNLNPPPVKVSKHRQRSFTRNMILEQDKYRLDVSGSRMTTLPSYPSYDRKPAKRQNSKQNRKKKRSAKYELLNILKQELKMEADAFEEPQTMHDALRMIVRNKRRCRMSIRLVDSDPSVNTNPRSDDTRARPCTFKRRQVLSTSTHSTIHNANFRRYNPQTVYNPTIKTSALPRKFSFATHRNTIPVDHHFNDLPETDLSEHSIEVKDFNSESSIKEEESKHSVSPTKTPVVSPKTTSHHFTKSRRRRPQTQNNRGPQTQNNRGPRVKVSTVIRHVHVTSSSSLCESIDSSKLLRTAGLALDDDIADLLTCSLGL